MTGISASAALARIRLSVDGPSRSGIMTSMRIKSGGCSEAIAIARSPESAVRTSYPDSRHKDDLTTSQISGSSSTYRTDWHLRIGMSDSVFGGLSDSLSGRAGVRKADAIAAVGLALV